MFYGSGIGFIISMKIKLPYGFIVNCILGIAMVYGGRIALIISKKD